MRRLQKTLSLWAWLLGLALILPRLPALATTTGPQESDKTQTDSTKKKSKNKDKAAEDQTGKKETGKSKKEKAAEATPPAGAPPATKTDKTSSVKETAPEEKKKSSTLPSGETSRSATVPSTPAAAETNKPATPAPAPSKNVANKTPPGGAASEGDIANAKGSGKVWVNLESGVYHKGGRWYGHTKTGKFMTEEEAQKAGYREAKQE